MDLGFLETILVGTYFNAAVETEIHLADITAQKIHSLFSLLDLRTLWALSALLQGCLSKSLIHFHFPTTIFLELQVLLKSNIRVRVK